MIDNQSLIKRISFELSNICHYSSVHKKCPLHFENKPVILPMKIVCHVLDTVATWCYKGKIGFHTYNEPGIDPRLFMLIEYARKKCPESYIAIMTNGFYLDENLVTEYEDVGVNEILISAYSEKDYQLFSSFNTQLKVTIQKPVLDERLDLYSGEKLFLNKPCHAPYNELMITRKGQVGLCCLDWKKEEVFGDLNIQSLEEVLQSEKMQSAHKKLSQGRRDLNICSHCDWSR